MGRATKEELLDLSLNDGTFAAQDALDALQTFQKRTDLRFYSDPDHDDLRQEIAGQDGVDPSQIFLHNGSGPLLKLCVPFLIEKAIRSSARRMVRHLLKKDGFPLITRSCLIEA